MFPCVCIYIARNYTRKLMRLPYISYVTRTEVLSEIKFKYLIILSKKSELQRNHTLFSLSKFRWYDCKAVSIVNHINFITLFVYYRK